MFRRAPVAGLLSLAFAVGLTTTILGSASGEEAEEPSTTTVTTAGTTASSVDTSSTTVDSSGTTVDSSGSTLEPPTTTIQPTSTTSITTPSTTTESATTTILATTAAPTTTTAPTTTSTPTTSAQEPSAPTTEATPSTVKITGRAGLDVDGDLMQGPNLLRINFIDQDSGDRMLALVQTGDAMTGQFEGTLRSDLTYRAEVTICCNVPTVKITYSDLAFTADTDLDFTIPATEVVFEVHDAQDNGVADADIVVPSATGGTGGTTWTARVYAEPTDENGETRVVLPLGTASDPDNRPSVVLSDGVKDTFAFTEIGAATAPAGPTVTQPEPDSSTAETTTLDSTTEPGSTTEPESTTGFETTVAPSTSTTESESTTKPEPTTPSTTEPAATSSTAVTTTPEDPTLSDPPPASSPTITVGEPLLITSVLAVAFEGSTLATSAPTTSTPATSTPATTTLELTTTTPGSTSTPEQGPSPITTGAPATTTTVPAPTSTPPETTVGDPEFADAETTTTPDTTTPDTTTPDTTTPDTTTSGPASTTSGSSSTTIVGGDSQTDGPTTTVPTPATTPSSAPPPAGPVIPEPSGANIVRIRIPAPVGVEITGQAGLEVLGELAPGSHSLRVNFYRVDNDELAARVTYTGDNNTGAYSARLLAGVLYRAEVIICCQGPTIQVDFEDLIFGDSVTLDLLTPAAEMLIEIVDESGDRVYDSEVSFFDLQGTTTSGVSWTGNGSPDDESGSDDGDENEFSVVLPVGAIVSQAADAAATISIDEEDPITFTVPDIVFNANTITVVVADNQETTSSELQVTRPWVTPTLSTERNDAGWINADAEITWAVSDPAPAVGLPGIELSPTAVAAEGTSTYWSDEACDDEGNCTKGSLEVKLDSVAPSSVILGFTDGSLRTLEPTPRCSASDATSKLKGECELETTVTASELDVESGVYTTTYTVTATATDNADNITISVKTYRMTSGEAVELTTPPITVEPESVVTEATAPLDDSTTTTTTVDEAVIVDTTTTTGPTTATTTPAESPTTAADPAVPTTGLTTTAESTTTSTESTTTTSAAVPTSTVVVEVASLSVASKSPEAELWLARSGHQAH